MQVSHRAPAQDNPNIPSEALDIQQRVQAVHNLDKVRLVGHDLRAYSSVSGATQCSDCTGLSRATSMEAIKLGSQCRLPCTAACSRPTRLPNSKRCTLPTA